ncbi:MAG TPA: ATP-binding cassette domain-containing protein [Gammaproteobacteria bacterium]|nr:ATP-binding cassette domain-containing protein [Gammaproteobacteria bacterium]
MITLRNVTLNRGTTVLLKNVNWTIYPGQRIGLIGANGSGKSSLFALLLNNLHADQGDVDISCQRVLAHVAQETPAYARSALDFVLDGDRILRHLEAELLKAEEANDGHRIGDLHEEFGKIDAYTAPARAAQLLSGLGFTQEEQQKPVSDFSGGWRVRLNLAKALMCPSDILLLDEPTNHLDLDAVIWLEQWLIKYPGTLLLISHDRDFLDQTVDHIAYIVHQQLEIYAGNYSTFEKTRAAHILLQQAAYEKQQKQIAHMQGFVNRFRAKASKARQAQSRMKAIERLELVNAVQIESPFHFHFRPPLKCPNPLLTLDEASIAYGEKKVLDHLSFSIGPDDRIGILGPNGAGKSSLIKLLAGEIDPATGIRETSSGLKIGYFAQHQVDHLNLQETPMTHLRELAPNVHDQELRTYLGTFGFVGTDVFDPIKQFSGGEKSRLALALLIWQRPNLLLLDEPTNHLDLEMRNALSIALQEYEGAMLLVSHDRFLLRATVDRLVLVANHRVEPFTGDMPDYEKWLLDYRRQTNNSRKKGSTEPMTNLITLDNVSLAFGLDVLLDRVKLQIEKGERVCLIGRNGAGKSSLMKIIEGTQSPDSGTLWRKPALRMARLTQELPQNLTETVYEFVAGGLAETGELLAQFNALTHRVADNYTEQDLKELERLQHAIDSKNGWHFEQEIKRILERLQLPNDQRMADLSGGWQRRAALARALVTDPELLLLDEPTNHLDIEAIQWLEEDLLRSGVALIFITHDRALLKRLATRIIELDRGQLTSWPGDYENFLRRKEEMLHAEEKQNAEFDKKLAEEERWIRQGIKARRTRNEGRVRALKALRETRAKRREVQGKASFDLHAAEKSGQLVVEVNHISQTYHHKKIIGDFSLRIMRGDKIGLIGPNGIGKSTLLNILLGNLTPQQGTVRMGTQLHIAYFDQLRKALDPEKSVMENVSPGSDTIEINGKKRHIISYLGDFLFTPARAMTPVKALSGGECNRLLLARLFSQPSNLLVLDEPTNDLDIETLELLEELLGDYPGTLLVVSHDRAFLDNVVTSTLVFEGNGVIQDYVGGYEDGLAQKKSNTDIKNTIEKKPAAEKSGQKLSYKEQKELEELPKRIDTLEAEQAALQAKTAQPDFYQQDEATVSEAMQRLKTLAEMLEKAYERWAVLDQKAALQKK